MIRKGIIFLLCGALTFGPLGSAVLAEESGPDVLIEEEPAAVLPETSAPETSAPETAAPETSAPETATPETAAPETAAPETAAPETAAPETATPETSAPETSAPGNNAPGTGQTSAGEDAPPAVSPETNAPGTSLPETNRPGSGSAGGRDPLIEEETSFDVSGEEDVTITREKMKQGLRSGEKFQIEIKIKNNRRDTRMTKVRLKLEPEEGISLDAEQKTDSITVKNLEPGEEVKVKVKLAADRLPENKSTVKMKTEVSYQRQDKNGIRKEKAQTMLLLPVEQSDGKNFTDTAAGGDTGGYYGGDFAGGGYDGGGEQKTIDPMTPNLIVSRYSYGKEVMAGEEFVLEMELQNTNGKITVENTVMSADTGDALVIADSSNTFYLEQLKPRETVKKTLKLKALPDGQTANGAVTLSFKYEYLKKEERAQGTSEVKIAIPIVHPDRFSVGEIKTEEEVRANEETSISLPYVNKGKSTVYNMEARLETGMSSDENYKFLGNVEAGSSGSIDFFVTPQEAGKQEAKLIVTYEDAAGNEKKAERLITLQAEENMPEEIEDFEADQVLPEEDMGSGSLTGMLQKGAAIGGGIVLIALLLLFKRRRYKKSIQFHGEV